VEDQAYKPFITVVAIVMGLKIIKERKERLKRDKGFLKSLRIYRKKYTYNQV
jgi:hypothetical protein